jgi:hypothetical protein
MNRAGMLRLAVYLKDAMLLAMENYAFDLLMGAIKSRPMKLDINSCSSIRASRASTMSPSANATPDISNDPTQIPDIFKAINDPVTNEPVFSLVLKMPEENKNLHAKNGKSFFHIKEDPKSRGMQRDFHVFSEDTGDVLIIAVPGYHLEFNAGTATEAGNFFQPSTFFGQHGHDPRLPEMKAIFYAAGPDFKRRSLKEVNNVDVAPTIAELLGIDPPADAQGEKISSRDDYRP